jgi:hypothetical protein
MTIRRIALAVLTACALASSVARGQTAAEVVDRGVKAYQGLDLSAAAGLLRRALAVSGRDSLSLADRLRALDYLGATEFLRGSEDSTAAVFRRAVLLSPTHELDALVFPPEITSHFAQVKRDTKAVRIEVPAQVRFRAGENGFRPRLIASSVHQLAVTVDRGDGSVARVLYRGLIGDSLEVLWDGRDSSAVPVPSARYYLRVESLGVSGEPVRVVRVPLEVHALPADTVVHPERPDSLLLPERTPRGRDPEALIGGVVAGLGLAALPSLVGSAAELSTGRFVLAGSVTVAGFVAFFTQRGGKPIPGNIASNEAVLQEWRGRVDLVTQGNQRLQSDVELSIAAGPPSVVDLREP